MDGWCTEVAEVATGWLWRESGCGSAGSFSVGVLVLRDVFCAEEFEVDSGDAGRWRFGCLLGGYVVT